MEQDEITPKQILDGCSTILDNLANDLYGFLPVVNIVHLDNVKTQYTAHLRADMKKNQSNTKNEHGATTAEHPAIQAYKRTIRDWDRITTCDVKLNTSRYSDVC